MSTQLTGLTIEQRRAILQKEINGYAKNGWRVISQTDTTAQLVKPKRLSCLWAILTVGIALLLYLAAKDETAYLEVDEKGKLRRR